MTSGASMSSSASAEGALRRRLCTNCSSIRKVSRYEAIVCALARRCCISRWVKNRSSKSGEAGLASHDGSPQRRSSRAIACAISSGLPLRYQ